MCTVFAIFVSIFIGILNDNQKFFVGKWGFLIILALIFAAFFDFLCFIFMFKIEKIVEKCVTLLNSKTSQCDKKVSQNAKNCEKICSENTKNEKV